MISTTNYIFDFIQLYSLPQAVAKDVLLTREDCDDFYIGFYGRNRHITDDLLDYREYKIEESKITLDIFLDMCYTKGMKSTFEKVFFQSFTSLEVSIISDAVAEGKVTLEKLFNEFQKNPNVNILKNVI